jgi:hypothetical protein
VPEILKGPNPEPPPPPQAIKTEATVGSSIKRIVFLNIKKFQIKNLSRII